MSMSAVVQSGSFKVVEEPLIDTSELVTNGDCTVLPSIDGVAVPVRGTLAIENESVKYTADGVSGSSKYLNIGYSPTVKINKMYRVTASFFIPVGNSVLDEVWIIARDSLGYTYSPTRVTTQGVWQTLEMTHRFAGAPTIVAFGKYVATAITSESFYVDNISIKEIQEIPVGAKYIEMQSTDSQLSFSQPHAYGTWTFSFKTHNSVSSGIGLINTLSEIGHSYGSPTGHGYSLQPGWNAATDLAIVRHNGANGTNLFKSLTGVVLKDTWYDIKVTRTLDGEWTFYIKSNTDLRYNIWTLVPAASGSTNPKTDNTYTESNFMVWDGDTGDTLKSYQHRVGVEV